MSLLSSIFGFIGAGRAGKIASTANQNAQNAVLNATKDGQTMIQGGVTGAQAGLANAVQGGTDGVRDTLTSMGGLLNNAGSTAIGNVNEATSGANLTLQGLMDQIRSGTNAYTDSGKSGLTGLDAFTSSLQQPQDKLSFNYDDYKNSDAYNFQMQQGQKALENSMAAGGMASGGGAAKALTQFGQGLASTYYNDAFNRAKSTFDTNQAATVADRGQTLQGLMGQIQAGEYGTTANNAAATALGGQQAANTLAAGNFAGNTNLTLGQLLAQLNTQGSEFNASLGLQGAGQAAQIGANGANLAAQLGLQGAQQAGNFAVGSGNAQAGAVLGQYNNLAGGLDGLLGMVSPMVGSIPLGGGNATTLAGLLGGH